MACALPAVCAHATGTQSLVVEGKTGHLLDAADIQGFADALSGLIAAPERRAAFGQGGLERSRGYSWSAVMDSLEANYREVLASAASTRR
jgi:glycosyltransferase involved in cell wall biosynthesis